MRPPGATTLFATLFVALSAGCPAPAEPPASAHAEPEREALAEEARDDASTAAESVAAASPGQRGGAPVSPAAADAAPPGGDEPAPEAPAAGGPSADERLLDELSGDVGIVDLDASDLDAPAASAPRSREDEIAALEERARTEAPDGDPVRGRAADPAPEESGPRTRRGSGRWLTDLGEARRKARFRNAPILAFFTGSDWCGWCKRLKAEVFDTDAFRSWAADHVVLLELDFPRSTPLPAELRRQNEALKERYGVDAYPTVLFLDADGERLGRSGYREGGAAAWCANAERLLAR